jgi:hypothetical protein
MRRVLRARRDPTTSLSETETLIITISSPKFLFHWKEERLELMRAEEKLKINSQLWVKHHIKIGKKIPFT